MLDSEQKAQASLPTQIYYWNKWNAEARESGVGVVSVDQARVILSWLQDFRRTDFDIIDVGCGAGWLCKELTKFGRVTGTDLANEVLSRAAQRVPSATFVAGDFMQLEFPPAGYDVAISLEVLSHVADQPAFLKKIARILRSNGYLMLATQNRPALMRNDIAPPGNGQLRHWVDHHELSELLSEHFEVLQLFSITPQFNRGFRRYLNSYKLHNSLRRAGLGAISKFVKERQEKAWLGWTLMALARVRS